MPYAKFTPEGIPFHIIPKPQDGYDPLPEGMTADQASVLMLVMGEWVKRPPPPPPTDEEISAQVEALRLVQIEADAIAEGERQERIGRQCLPLLISRQLGEITQAQFAERVAQITSEA
jgi:hypothetical protein